ncbi:MULTISPECIES: hypothetical protein [unclassified Variovorax]|uniref:hypothetical protein n=1 Tax=unclassified Variovorax TaxID=663243 RepID=UPI0025783192|nr:MULTISPECIES: hypothetical protein [unclassified Variovorax]MDM0089200.1 hypothetical protein [Variovorax sp. J22G40]MDM0147273.1 hypothetical protein [Variovorax sp. J2P1-31]
MEHEQIEGLLTRLKTFRRAIKSETTATINKGALRSEAKALGALWHKEFLPVFRHSLAAEDLDGYNAHFTRLIRISAPNNLVKSYMEALDAIIKPFNDNLVIPSQQGAFGAAAPSAFDTFFAALSNSEESEYLAEAIACAKAGHQRAAVVLGWSAAIDRIHRVIEHIGFDRFNTMSQQMHLSTTGRYKKFTNKGQHAHNLAEIREVFDSMILWVIEGMQLIDTNQHTRLASCFDIRCHGAHPGDAPITPYNLMSFFSDLDQIVFLNPKFALPAKASVLPT